MFPSLPSLDQLTAWLWPLLFVVVGLAVGVLFQRYLIDRLRRKIDGGRWRWDDVVMNALGRGPLLWFAALGMWAAVEGLELPAEVAGYLQDGIVALVILSITLFVARVGANAVRNYARRSDKGLPASSLIVNIAKVLVYALGVLVILGHLGVNITGIVAGLGIGGLAVALALQDTLSNLFSGFQIILTRQVVTGDYIQLESGQEGYVQDVKWRNTTIKTRLDDAETVIPNRKLADAVVINYSLPQNPMWVKIEVGVHYDSDLERVEEVTREVAGEVAREVRGASEDVDPVLRYREFDDSAITFVVRLRVEEFDRQFLVRHELIKKLHRRFEGEEITIPFPQRTLGFSSPLETVESQWSRGADSREVLDAEAESGREGSG